MSTWARPDAYYRRIQEMRKRVLLIMGVEPYIKLSSVWTAGPSLILRLWHRTASVGVGRNLGEQPTLRAAAP